MKNLQNGILFLGLIALLAYNIWDKLEQQKRLSINYEAKKEQINLTLPEAIDFCDENVPLKEPSIREQLDEELHKNVAARYSLRVVIKRANRWFPQIEKILEEEGIPNDFKYLMVVESALSNRVSPVGAAGFWQIMKSTGQQFGLEVNQEVDERYAPLLATRAACRYFKQAYKELNNWTLVAASYNRGISGIKRALKKQKVRSFYNLYLNEQTNDYVYRILAFKEVYTKPEKYGLTVPKRSLYQNEPVEYVTINQDIPDLVAFAQQQQVTFKQLIEVNPWLVGESLTVQGKDKTYQIAIPKNKNMDIQIDTEIGNG